MSPQRIQMSRQKPWRPDHPDAVIVARPSKWGNPYAVEEYARDYPEAFSREHRRMAVSDLRGLVDGRWGEDRPYPTLNEIRAELAGKDLACWCPLDEPCHADLLIEIANQETP